jgi:nucleotide-binding universal stress UspA family protein
VERIVVGVDGSAEAGRALRWAAEEARLRHAALDVVHAWHTPYFNGYPYATAPFDVVSGLVLGSVSHHVVQNAGCPVVVVPSED